MTDGPSRAEERTTATVEALFADLRGLAAEDTDAETEAEVLDIKHLLAEAHDRGLIDSEVRDLAADDAAQAFVGSVIFAAPLLVEGGIFDIADHLFEVTLLGLPVYLIANTCFVVVMTYALLEWTGRNRDDIHPLAGVVPVRVLMVLLVSFLVSAAMMTVWGRVGGWESPAEALARISVVWTVASLGAALGDIVSEDEDPPTVLDVDGHERAVREDAGGTDLTDSALVAAIDEQFEELESTLETSDTRERAQQIREETLDAALETTFGVQIEKYTSRDIAEAFVGSIFFAVPFLVEDGVFDVADFFLSFRVASIPVFFILNTGFVFVMILALVYYAGPQDVTMSRPIFGFVPRRLVGIGAVSFLTAAALMTMWGRVGNWQDPVVAVARISVVWTVASFGASLGDVLPGESSGADINDDLAALTDGDGRRGANETE